MSEAWAIVFDPSDGDTLSTIGPYDSKKAAEEAADRIHDVADINWSVVRLYPAPYLPGKSRTTMERIQFEKDWDRRFGRE